MDPVDLSAGRVYLRSPAPADVPAVVAACRDPETVRWTRVPSPYSTSDAHEWLRLVAAGWAGDTELSWAVAEVADGGYAGSISLRLPAGAPAEVGYLMAPWARGRGLMTEALGAVSRFAADALGLDRIELLHHLGNAASCQVAVKCGYRVVGVRMAGCEQRGTLHDAEVHVRETGQPSRST